MKDQIIEILLHTPLLTLAEREQIRDKPVLENILRIGGKVIAENNGGIQIQVKWIGSDKQVEKSPPFSVLFIPFHKIDHVLVG